MFVFTQHMQLLARLGVASWAVSGVEPELKVVSVTRGCRKTPIVINPGISQDRDRDRAAFLKQQRMCIS